MILPFSMTEIIYTYQESSQVYLEILSGKQNIGMKKIIAILTSNAAQWDILNLLRSHLKTLSYKNLKLHNKFNSKFYYKMQRTKHR